MIRCGVIITMTIRLAVCGTLMVGKKSGAHGIMITAAGNMLQAGNFKFIPDLIILDGACFTNITGSSCCQLL